MLKKKEKEQSHAESVLKCIGFWQMVSSINVTGTREGQWYNESEDLIRTAFEFLKHHFSGKPSIFAS